MGSKCEKYKDLIIRMCEDGLSYSEIQERLPEHISTGMIWRYAKSIGISTKGLNKAHFQKGNKVGEKKRKTITWEENENGCWICISHKLTKAGYAISRINGKETYIHRFMYEQKHGPIPESIEACHKCDNPACINPDHIFLGTHKQNMDDMIKKGRQTLGERNPMAKLTENDVRKMVSLGHLKQAELAQMFNVAQSTVSMILNNKSWTHV